jgi:hypothetical protein
MEGVLYLGLHGLESHSLHWLEGVRSPFPKAAIVMNFYERLRGSGMTSLLTNFREDPPRFNLALVGP